MLSFMHLRITEHVEIIKKKWYISFWAHWLVIFQWGQWQVRNRASVSLFCLLSKHTVSVVTVYIKDFLHHMLHCLLQVQYANADCLGNSRPKPFAESNRRKAKPLKPLWCFYNGAMRSYLPLTTSIGSISLISACNHTGALTDYSSTW